MTNNEHRGLNMLDTIVLMGATADGRKELIAIQDGYRESEQSWKSLLLDVKQRGLAVDPQLATGDVADHVYRQAPGLSLRLRRAPTIPNEPYTSPAKQKPALRGPVLSKYSVRSLNNDDQGTHRSEARSAACGISRRPASSDTASGPPHCCALHHSN